MFSRSFISLARPQNSATESLTTAIANQAGPAIDRWTIRQTHQTSLPI